MTETKRTTGGTKDATRWGGASRIRRVTLSGLIVAGIALFVSIEMTTEMKIQQVQEQVARLKTKGEPLGYALQSTLSLMHRTLLGFQLSGDEREQREFLRSGQVFQQRLMINPAPDGISSREGILRQIKIAFDSYLEKTRNLAAQPQRTIRRDSASQVQDAIRKAQAPLDPLIQDLIEVERNQESQAYSQLAASLGMAQSVFRLCMLAWLVFVAFAVGLIYALLISPLRARLDQSEIAAERQEKLASLGVLAAGVAHEIRNPLAAIKCRIFSLKKILPVELREDEDVAVIQNEINRLERIVKDFLLFARPSEPVMTRLQARSILEGVGDLLKPQLLKKAISLTIEGEDPAWVNADKQQLQQVLINLVQNAAESIECSGVIALRAKTGMANFSRRPSPAVILEVSDTGKGIPRDVEKRIFDPFYSTKEAGTGLGLPIAARIIEKHGGFIQYQTELNRGTTFSLVLPRLESDASLLVAH